MDLSDKAKAIVKAIAPTIGGALGGPFGALAGKVLAGLLGGDAKAAETAIISGDPEALAKLRQAELDFKAKLAELGVQEEALAYADMDSARKREMTVRDMTPSLLAFLITIGFFGVLGYILVVGKPPAGGDALLVLLGSLGSAWISVVSYYYGSTAGSAQKTDAIAALARR